VNQRRHQCAKCRHQISLTSGTILHRTKIPLTDCFWEKTIPDSTKAGLDSRFPHMYNL
jgi:hypothetical protein